MGLLYLVQERELKARSPRALLLPDARAWSAATPSAAAASPCGFGFLTLAIVTGVLWSHSAHGRYWTGDAKEWSALVAWVIYVGPARGAPPHGAGAAGGRRCWGSRASRPWSSRSSG